MNDEDLLTLRQEIQAAFNRRLDWERVAARPHNESYAGVWEALFATKEALLLLADGVDEIRERLQGAHLEPPPPADPNPEK